MSVRPLNPRRAAPVRTTPLRAVPKGAAPLRAAPVRSSARPWVPLLAPLLALSLAVACAAPPRVEHLDQGVVMPPGMPFSEAVRVGDTLYLSGQIGVVPGSLALAPGGMQGEARQTLQNIRATLEAHGARLDDVVKCTVMLADMSQWGAFNAVYMEFFDPPFPARSALGASGLALGALVEVECIAVVR